MSRSTTMLIVLAAIACIGSVAIPTFADSWDAYANFSSSSNPNGAWSYGYSTTTPYNFTLYTGSAGLWQAQVRKWLPPGTVSSTSMNYNPSSAYSVFPAQSLSLTENSASYYSVLRWTATASGTYSITAIFKNLNWSAAYPLHSNKGLILKNGVTTLFNENTPTYGIPTNAQPVLNYDQTAPYYGSVTVVAGDTIDFVAARDTANPRGAGSGDCQVQASIESGSYSATGHVQNSASVGLAGVKVIVDGGLAYAVTNSAGDFSLVLLDGNHTLTANLSSFTSQSQSVNVTGAGAYTVPTFTLANSGVWNLANDYNVVYPVSGAWQYGKASRTADPVTTSTFVKQFALALFDTEKTSGGNQDEYYTKWVWCDAYTFGSGYWISPSGAFLGTSNAIGQFVTRATGSAPNETMSVARWTAPAAGNYTFGGSFTNKNGADQYGYSLILNQTTSLQGGNLVKAPSSTVFTVAPFTGMRSMSAGDTLDFVGRTSTQAGYVWIDAVIKSGQWGVTGYVQDSVGNKLAGAKVEVVGGTQSTTTDSAGNYTIPVANSTSFSVKGSKAGFGNATYAVSVNGTALTVQNITLPPGATISGQVTANTPTHSAIAGALIASTDGAYSGTTDASGNYSIVVTKGAYSFNVYKLGYLLKTVAIDASAGNVTQNIGLDVGYDLATDAAQTTNPRGVWSFGGEISTAGYDAAAFGLMTTYTHWSVPSTDAMWLNSGDPGYMMPAFFKNVGTTPQVYTGNQGLAWYGGPVYREVGKVVATPNGRGNGFAIARFTASAGGLYHVTGKFAGARQVSPYTQQKVAVKFTNAAGSSSYVYGGPTSVKYINGFIGTAANSFTDSVGTPVYTYSLTQNLAVGDKMDAIVYDDVAYTNQGGYGATGGFTQVDMTVTPDKTTLAGRVTASNLAGSPGIAGAQITATFGSQVFSTVTDASGNYSVGVAAGTYSVQAQASGYAPVTTSGVVLAQDATVTANFSLTHSGIWDLKSDFSTLYNPVGQWTYGYLSDTTGGGVAPAFRFDPSTTLSTNLYGMTGWLYSGYNGWWNFIAMNNTGAPISASDWNRNFYVETGALALGGGDRTAAGGGGAAVRWTSPDARIIKLTFTLSSQLFDGGSTYVSALKNLALLNTQNVTGFVGRAAAGYTDAIAGTPTSTYTATLAVSPGDTLEVALGRPSDIWTHWMGNFGWPERTTNIGVTITTDTTLAAAKLVADGVSVSRTGLVVSKVFPDCIYIETADRSSGIKVTGAGVQTVGQSVDIAGVLGTTSDGERYMAATVAAVTGTGSVTPVLLTNKDLGGGPNNFDAASGSGQRGVEDGAGLNNIGLLVKTTGKVTVVGDSFFYIDDGTHAKDASIFNGIRVWCPVGTTMPASGAQVSVTGISGIYNIGGRYFRGVRIAGSSDVMAQ